MVRPLPLPHSCRRASIGSSSDARRAGYQPNSTPTVIATAIERVAGIVRHLPDGLSELYLHPATAGGFEGAAPGYDYAGELAALTSPDVRAAVAQSGAALGAFADFA